MLPRETSGKPNDFLVFSLCAPLGDLRNTKGFPKVFAGCSLGRPSENKRISLCFRCVLPRETSGKPEDLLIRPTRRAVGDPRSTTCGQHNTNLQACFSWGQGCAAARRGRIKPANMFLFRSGGGLAGPPRSQHICGGNLKWGTRPRSRARRHVWLATIVSAPLASHGAGQFSRGHMGRKVSHDRDEKHLYESVRSSSFRGS